MTDDGFIYADTSALAKLVVQEDETVSLRGWLRTQTADGALLVTNTIGAVELTRVASRFGQGFSDTATRLLGHVGILELTSQQLDLAARLPLPMLRTLDALHISSASSLANLRALVAYDNRLLDAAADWGLPIASPTTGGVS